MVEICKEIPNPFPTLNSKNPFLNISTKPPSYSFIHSFPQHFSHLFPLSPTSNFAFLNFVSRVSMSAGICGKRVGFEEIFGSSSPTSFSSAKRSRFSAFGSPTRSQDHSPFQGQSFDDFNGRVDSAAIGNCYTVPNERTSTCCQMSHEMVEEAKDGNPAAEEGNNMLGSKWVDMLAQEMTSAVDQDDARIRVAKVLETFEQNITACSRQSEELKLASLKEHFQSLLNDNQILKRAVAIQHERNLEQEEKMKEVHQLQHVLCQYQEQIQSLEVRNYTLNLHLQRAQSVSGHFHHDRF